MATAIYYGEKCRITSMVAETFFSELLQVLYLSTMNTYKIDFTMTAASTPYMLNQKRNFSACLKLNLLIRLYHIAPL